MLSEKVALVKFGKLREKRISSYSQWKKCQKQEFLLREVLILSLTNEKYYSNWGMSNYHIFKCFSFIVNMQYAF